MILDNMNLSDELDGNDCMELYTDDDFAYIDKADAIEIVKHLSEVFDIE